MKWIKITADKDYLVLSTWDNYAKEECKELGIKIGEDMVVFYRNHKDDFIFEGVPYYTKAYHPQETLSYLLAKNPNLQKMIDKFDLVLSV